MAGYNDTKAMIISTLMGRPAGTEIQPENQQAYELNMLDYIRSLELISSSPIIGIADETTTPVQPDNARVSYIAGVAQNRTVTFQNFIGENGQPLSITTGDMEAYLVIFIWNAQYWTMQAIPTNIVSSSDVAYFYYNYNIRKTYASVAAMNADSVNPIGIDGKPIKLGDIVSVVNNGNSSENGFYSYEGAENGWKLQSSFNFQLVQTTGTDVNSAMSQDAVSRELTSVMNESSFNTDDIKSKLGNKYIAETKTSSDMQNIYFDSTDNAIKSSSNLLSLILPYPPGCVFNYTITQGTMLSIKTFSSYPKIGNSDIISSIGNGSRNETTNMQYILFQFWKRDTDASPIVDVILSSCGVLANKKISLLSNQNKESRHISISELGSLPTDGISIVIPTGIIISTNGDNYYQPTTDITISKTGGYIYYLYLKYDNTFFISTTVSKELDYRSSLIAIISPKQNIPVSGLNCYKYNNVLYEPYSDNYLATIRTDISAVQSDITELTSQVVDVTLFENPLRGISFPYNTSVNVKNAIKRIWISCREAGNVEKVLDNCPNLYIASINNIPGAYSPYIGLSKLGTSDDQTFIWFLTNQTEPRTGIEVISAILSSTNANAWGITGWKPTINIEIDWDVFGANIRVQNTGIVLTLADLFRYSPQEITAENASPSIVRNSLYGKNIVCFGDSLTEMVDTTNSLKYSDYMHYFSGANFINCGIGGSQLRQRLSPVSNPSSNSEAYAALDIINMVKASCEQDFTKQIAANTYLIANASDDNTKQITALQNIDWGKVDAVTIFAGTNDWYGANAIGVTGSNDVRYTLGAINEMIRLLLTTYPHLKIYWFTPIVRWLDYNETTGSGTDAQWSDVYSVTGNGTLKEFSDKIQNEVVLNHIPVCDMYNSLGWNKYNFKNYFVGSDGTHPRTYNGVTYLAKKILQFILTNNTL